MLFKKLTFVLATLALVSLTLEVQAQKDKSKRPSPPAEASATMGDVSINLDYSSPAVKGRKVLDGLAPYGKVWRTGANEATTFEISSDVMIEGQKLEAGKYALFTIPNESEWTFIFNKNPDQWGAYNYNQQQDALRVKVKPGTSPDFQERMTFTIETKEDAAAYVNLIWANLAVGFNVTK